MLKEDNKEKEN